MHKFSEKYYLNKWSIIDTLFIILLILRRKDYIFLWYLLPVHLEGQWRIRWNLSAACSNLSFTIRMTTRLCMHNDMTNVGATNNEWTLFRLFINLIVINSLPLRNFNCKINLCRIFYFSYRIFYLCVAVRALQINFNEYTYKLLLHILHFISVANNSLILIDNDGCNLH